MNDKVKCNNCGFKGVVEKGVDNCPLCCSKGYLEWQDEGKQETGDPVTKIKNRKAQHTPGPWVVMGNQRESGHFDYVLPMADNKDFQANAALISAAPELLAAAIDALDGLEGRLAIPEAEIAGRLRAAIAKAAIGR